MKTVLNIEGMSCVNCAKHVKEALEAVGGVSSAAVDLDKKTAEVEHSGGLDINTLIDAVSEAGYEASAKKI